ncbi:MAG: hemin uptake protein HemP [Lysobacter sp.]|nr:MAG: hemin uptake protein HemP [Lysobacter sp.]
MQTIDSSAAVVVPTALEGGDDAAPPPAVFDSAGLLKGAREILIRHGGVCYRLRHTRNDKLILTK